MGISDNNKQPIASLAKLVGFAFGIIGSFMLVFSLIRFNSFYSQLIRQSGGTDSYGLFLLIGGMVTLYCSYAAIKAPLFEFCKLIWWGFIWATVIFLATAFIYGVIIHDFRDAGKKGAKPLLIIAIILSTVISKRKLSSIGFSNHGNEICESFDTEVVEEVVETEQNADVSRPQTLFRDRSQLQYPSNSKIKFKSMGIVFCWGCGKEIHETANVCPNCGAGQNVQNGANKKPIPDGVKGWSWGAFIFNGIWAIFNRTWWGLLAFLPFINFVVMIWLGFQGREMAWRNREWDSVEHFSRVQKKWSQWGVGFLLGAALLGLFAGIAIPIYSDYYAEEQPTISRKMEQNAHAEIASAEVSEIATVPQVEGAETQPAGGGPEPTLQSDNAEREGVCVGMDLAVTAEQLECLSKKYDIADKELNTVYKRLMTSSLEESRKATLKKEQRAWIKQKEAKCSQAGKEVEGGTLETVMINDCLVQETERRVTYLKEVQ